MKLVWSFNMYPPSYIYISQPSFCLYCLGMVA
jgi:hypothetical protein